jgi:hypothetical protein
MLYTFAALLDENEYFITTPEFLVIHYPDLDEAKKMFQSVYDNLKNPNASTEELNDQMETLLLAQPCILQFDIQFHQLGPIILSWSRNRASRIGNIPIIPIPHALIPMRSGFIQEYQALNILNDIQTTPYIREDGDMGYHRFRLREKE